MMAGKRKSVMFCSEMIVRYMDGIHAHGIWALGSGNEGSVSWREGGRFHVVVFGSRVLDRSEHDAGGYAVVMPLSVAKVAS